MNWSNYFIPTLKEDPNEAEAMSHKLLLRAGMVHMLTSGVYSYLPLGLRVLKNIEKIIREEMDAIGARELFLPCLHPIDLWKQTGRDEVLDGVMFKFEDGKKRSMCLGPTHEEVITDLVKNFVQSYKQLPVVLYQIQTKFRDELRARFGIVRACEFIMKDAYSFDKDQEGLQKQYDLMYGAYKNIFKRCGLDTVILAADSGAMGGDVSHEFMVPADIGEDKVLTCKSCGHSSGIPKDDPRNRACAECGKTDLVEQDAIELGHIFQLGTKYSKAQGATFLNSNGKEQPMIMGCYGIGVSRVIAAIVEKHHDENGIIWPKEIAPFDIEVVVVNDKKMEDEIAMVVKNIATELKAKGKEVLVDDRGESPGRKFNDADLIGMPLRVTVGKRNLKDGNVEVKVRSDEEGQIMSKDKVVEHLLERLS